MVVSQSRANSASATASAQLMKLELTDLNKQRQSLEQWKGKVLVVNFWATWCGPCKEEMPEFSRISEKYAGKGVQFVGIGIDSVDNISKFVQQYPVAYPLLAGENDAIQASAALGNKLMALPFTAILEAKGAVSQVKLGKMKPEDLEAAIQKALATR